MMTREQIIKIFEKGTKNKQTLIRVKIFIFMLLGITALIYAVWLAQVVQGVGWAYFGLIAILGIKLVSGEISSLVHRQWQNGCQYMLQFLAGRHNHLAWVYFCADKQPDHSLAEASDDGLCYRLVFWFTNKISCTVYGKKAVLDGVIRYFISNYPDVTTGYSQAVEKRFTDSPQQLKRAPQHTFDICFKKGSQDAKQNQLTHFERVTRRSSKAIRTAGVIFWFCVSFSVSVYFLTSFGYDLYLSLTCRSWPSTTGQISYSYNSEDKVDFSYTVNDVRHTNSRVSFSGDLGAVREAYPLGSTVTVYYEPSNPYQSVLVPSSLGAEGYIPLALGIIFAGLGWICFNWGIGRYKTVIDPVNWI